MSILVVVAHPDDEVLGCGGTIARLTSEGGQATACILCGQANARRHRPEDEALLADIRSAQARLGLSPPLLSDFPNIRLNTVPHIELVQAIERAIQNTEADLVFTHHPADLNDDHLHVSRACQAAVRLFQRKPGIKPLRGLYFMETLSATDWALAPQQVRFQPDTFVELGEEPLNAKIEALACYRNVSRPYPHSRSEVTIRALAVQRGSQGGVNMAEAFQTAIRIASLKESWR